jgi:uncharacterized protein DUF1707
MAMRYYAPFPGGDSFPGDHGLRGGHSEMARQRGGPLALRVGDAERDAAAADLGEHYAAGRLSLDELNERLDAVFSSKTFGHLTRIMADLPGPGRLPWRARPSAASDYWASAERPWHTATSMADFQTSGPQRSRTPSDRAGRFAALSLLMLAMLIWLFTALIFARHGLYHPGGGYGHPAPFEHSLPYEYQPGGPQVPTGP